MRTGTRHQQSGGDRFAIWHQADPIRNGTPEPGFDMETSLVVLTQFIHATRDAGYRGTAAAVAELVDNSYEANAKRVEITIDRHEDDVVVRVADDGCGMSPDVMRIALQFGG